MHRTTTNRADTKVQPPPQQPSNKSHPIDYEYPQSDHLNDLWKKVNGGNIFSQLYTEKPPSPQLIRKLNSLESSASSGPSSSNQHSHQRKKKEENLLAEIDSLLKENESLITSLTEVPKKDGIKSQPQQQQLLDVQVQYSIIIIVIVSDLFSFSLFICFGFISMIMITD